MMANSVFNKIHRFIFKFLENSQLFPFYARKQIFGVKYSVLLKNKSAEFKKLSLILPIPLENNYQKLKSEIKFVPNCDGISDEKMYKNKYAIWQVGLNANEAKNFTQEFEVLVSPASPILHKDEVSNFGLQDYKNNDLNVFCAANNFVSGEDPQIKKMALKIVGSEKNVLIIAKRINDFVISYLEYKSPILDLYTYKEALDKRQVDCGGFDTFFVSLCLAVGIPARVVCGFLAGYGLNHMHAWAEFMLPSGEWIPVDPSMEQLFSLRKTKKSGRFGYVGSDRVIFSYGCDIPVVVDGAVVKLPILQNPVVLPGIRPDDIEMEIEFVTKVKK